MIKSYGDKKTEKIRNGEKVKDISVDIQMKTKRALKIINNIASINDFRNFRGFNIEKLKPTEFWSIRINRQYRIVFKHKKGDYHEVQLSKHYE